MSSEAEIRSLLEARASQICDKNAEGTLSFYGEDIVNFDLAPPLAYRGPEAIDPAGLQAWFDSWDGAISVAFDRLEVGILNDLAFAFGLMHFGRQEDRRVRHGRLGPYHGWPGAAIGRVEDRP